MGKWSHYIGQIRNSRPHGIGVYRFDQKDRLGDWVDGDLTGYGEMTHQDGTIRYRGQWYDNWEHGYGEEIDEDGVYLGQFQKNKGRHGFGRVSLPDGRVTDTIWRSNVDTGRACNAEDVVGKAKQGDNRLPCIFHVS